MVGDNTFCSPLIGPPLGMSVCVYVSVCVFKVLICIHSPYTKSFKSQQANEGLRKGGRRREVDRVREEGAEKLFRFNAFPPEW